MSNTKPTAACSNRSDERAAQEIRGAVKLATPERVAENRHAGPARAIIVCRKVPACQDAAAEKVQKMLADTRSANLLGRRRPRQVHEIEPMGRDVLERV